VGGGTGDELSEHARECYGFLCNNWREGDDIALFGFSRGSSPFLVTPWGSVKLGTDRVWYYRCIYCPMPLGLNC
jgi:hypothetical protein